MAAPRQLRMAAGRHYRVSWPVAHRSYVPHVEGALAAPLERAESGLVARFGAL
jgi:hypothetical protein